MLTVHTIPGSPYGRAVLIACHEKNAPYRLAPVTPGAHKQPAYLAHHPFGRIPTVEDDGFWLYETQAVERYIDAVYGTPRALTPKDPKAEARMNQVMGIIDWYFFADNGAKTLVFNRVVAPKLGFPSNDEAAVAAIPATRHATEALAGFLAKSPYLAGDAFSLADIHAGAQVDMLTDCEEGVQMVKGTPIEAWLERLRVRPSFAATTWPRVAEAAMAAA
ncbi:MAG TPA: glutathione S-transferase family protein [Caulobacteraceae bacterium]|nr:glutathione S-transferase family protein [Caulobacteraceae bacterium]